jgi:hypothetical protein
VTVQENTQSLMEGFDEAEEVAKEDRINDQQNSDDDNNA